jgi:competence protein ComEC
MPPRSLRPTLLIAAWLAVAPTTVAGTATTPSPHLRVDFIDVGQGDAALITSPTGKTVLIDGGPREASETLVTFLRARGVGTLDLIVLTHRHEDHLGGLPAVVDAVGARLFMDASFAHPTSGYGALMRALRQRRIPVREAEVGRTIDLGGGTQIELLSPPVPTITGSRSDVNANSVVLRLDLGGTGFLFTGDAEAPTERWLLQTGARLRAQVLKVAHHGSRYSSTAPFLRAVDPLAAVISVGTHNDYKHPAAATLGRLESLSAHVYRTDLDGPVTVEADGKRLTIRTAHGKQEVLGPS